MEVQKIYPAMAGILADMDAITKDKKTEGFASFKYRGIDDVYNTLHPLLAKHKVFIMPEVLSTSREERTNEKGKMIAYVTMPEDCTFAETKEMADEVVHRILSVDGIATVGGLIQETSDNAIGG